MKKIISFSAIVLTILSLSTISFAQTFKNNNDSIFQNSNNEDFDKKFDDFIKTVRSQLQIETGISVGVVKDGKMVFQGKYGYLNVEKKNPLEAETPFYIASSTKSFVGFLAIMLADKGFFNLDDPIAKYLPTLVFDDKRLQPDKISIRDLLNHVHGISNEIVGFNTAYSGLKISDKQLLEAFQKHSKFNGNNNFAYTNIGYILVGLIIKQTTGKSWQENLKKYVLKPAKLNSTSPFVSDFQKSKLPFSHYTFNRENRLAQQSFLKIDQTMHAAGGMLSTVSDSAKWIMLNQNRGKFNNEQVFPEKYFAENLKPQSDLKATFFNYERTQYGLGWYHANLDKLKMLHSFGSFVGSRSHISFLPEQNVGICVFINESGRGMATPDLIANFGYGLLLGNENLLSSSQNELTKMANNLQNALKTPRPTPPKIALSAQELKQYEGKYSNASLGNLKVKSKDGKLLIKLGNIETSAIPSGKDSFATDFPYFFNLKFINDSIELDIGTKQIFSKNKKN